MSMDQRSSSDALRTPLCELLNVRYPIIQAGMAGGSTTPELVAAVSNAGGLGVFGGARLTENQLRGAIQAIKERTERPFGVNLLLAGAEPGNQDVATAQRFLNKFRQELGLPPGAEELPPQPSDFGPLIAAVLEEGVPVLSFGLGDPSPYIHDAHAAGTIVMAMVSTVDEAVRVAEGGADVIVAQGAEAGGHRSTFEMAADGDAPLVGTLALIPQVVDAVAAPVAAPVVAAGAIMDGRGLVAALALGAQGVQLGTRFLAARESGISDSHKERLLGATETDTVITRALSGRPARSIRNRLIDAWEEAGVEPLSYPAQNAAAGDLFRAAMASGQTDLFPLYAGQGLRLLKRGQRATDIVAEIADEAVAVLNRLYGLAG